MSKNKGIYVYSIIISFYLLKCINLDEGIIGSWYSENNFSSISFVEDSRGFIRNEYLLEKEFHYEVEDDTILIHPKSSYIDVDMFKLLIKRGENNEFALQTINPNSEIFVDADPFQVFFNYSDRPVLFKRESAAKAENNIDSVFFEIRGTGKTTEGSIKAYSSGRFYMADKDSTFHDPFLFKNIKECLNFINLDTLAESYNDGSADEGYYSIQVFYEGVKEVETSGSTVPSPLRTMVRRFIRKM